MKILLIGSGGREHAIAWKLIQSDALECLYAAPGNPGIANIATCVSLDAVNHQAVIDFCRTKQIDLVIIGPEAPLVDGLTDSLAKENIAVFGPSRAAARLEGSKLFTKQICDQAAIPTATYQAFDNAADAKTYISKNPHPVAVKADGLAGGKGVILCPSTPEALTAIDHCFNGGFDSAGKSIIIEELLSGIEASAFFITDGQTVKLLGTAQDYKRAYDGDQGPNTGGMGAISPAPALSPELEKTIEQTIIQPAINALNEQGTPYIGILYAGLMITSDGPMLLEFNCRFGDPECQAILPRLESDLLAHILAATEKRLDDEVISLSPSSAVTLVLAASGYPVSPKTGELISGLSKLDDHGDVTLFHAGTKRMAEQLETSGGRVLSLTATAEAQENARSKVYKAAEFVQFKGKMLRTDIGTA